MAFEKLKNKKAAIQDSRLKEAEEVIDLPIKTEAHCTVEDCLEVKQPGQTHLCAKHVRSS